MSTFCNSKGNRFWDSEPKPVAAIHWRAPKINEHPGQAALAHYFGTNPTERISLQFFTFGRPSILPTPTFDSIREQFRALEVSISAETHNGTDKLTP